jgi:5-methylcytosine-specific restriction endonuclease McrA
VGVIVAGERRGTGEDGERRPTMFHPDVLDQRTQARDPETRHLDGCPALVLNADYTPLSYYPLSVWPWQTAIKAVFLERVDIVDHYEREVHSANFAMKLPSVIALKQYVKPSEHPAFTRFNLFLRDRFQCQYCGVSKDLTFDHVIPRAQGGRTTWENVATACAPCNLKKGPDPPDELAIAGPRQELSAKLSARKLAGLVVLGH